MTRFLYGNLDLLGNQVLNITLQILVADPPGTEGQVYYNSVSDEIRYYNGSTWVAVGTAGAGGPPSGGAGGDLTGSYPSPQIAAGVIVDGDVNASANIAQAKISGLTTSLAGKADTTTDHIAGAGLTGGGTLAASRTFAVGAGTGITVNADDVAVNKGTTDTWYLALGGGTLTGFLTLHSDPTNPLHPATKQYVDLTSQGLDYKNSAKAASTANLTLSAPQTVDGIALIAGDRVLVKDQATPAQNGIYTVAAGAWVRAVDADGNGEISDGTLIPIEGGTTNGDSLWLCTATGATPWVPGTSTSTWTRYGSSADLIAGAGMTKTGNTLDVVSANAAHMTVGADSIAIVSAPKWTTGQTIALTGDVTGTSAAWDGSAGISFVTAIAAGVIMDADINASANIAQTKILNLTTDLAGKVPTGRSVIAGLGLTGGGTLAADATLNVVGDANLSVTADQVAVLSAPKWTTGRTIALTGDVTGTSVAFDGQANLSFATVCVQAAKLTTGRTISLTGDVTGTSVAFDGTAALSFATAIGAGVIVDADINSGAAIATSKISGLDTALGTLTTNSAKRYSVTLGTASPQTVTHNLNTRDVQVSIYNTNAPFEEIWMDVEHTTVNTVTLKHNPALPAGYRCVVTG
jgi:hypothetical protein